MMDNSSWLFSSTTRLLGGPAEGSSNSGARTIRLTTTHPRYRRLSLGLRDDTEEIAFRIRQYLEVLVWLGRSVAGRSE